MVWSLKWKSSLLKGFAFLKTSWLFSEVRTKEPDESDCRMDFSRANSNSDLELLTEGDGWTVCWTSGAGGLEGEVGALGWKARGGVETLAGAALVGEGSSGKVEEFGGGVLPSILMMLKCG